MIRIIIFLAILFPGVVFCQDQDQDSVKLGHRFYIKTEILNSLKTVFEPKSYDLDVQLSVRLSNPIHLVATYGKTTFYLNRTAESIYTPDRFQNSELIGEANNRSSLMIRYYPFNYWGDFMDLLFVEAGAFYMDYTGSTLSTIYEGEESNITNQNLRSLQFERMGPQLNFGISRRFSGYTKQKFSFTPEIFMGIYYNNINIHRDEVEFIVGPPEEVLPYSEKKVRFSLRAKIGIGIF